MKKTILTACLFFALSIVVFPADKFTPGVQWNDTGGKRINAHGCCVVFHEGSYYWFGEDRTGFVSNGVSCYKSEDLYNWKRIGYALSHSGSQTPEENDIGPGRLMERPKVIFNEQTQKWIMWFHWERSNSDYGAAKVGVAYSDNIEGPYEFLRAFQPNGHGSRDQTLFLDTDGKAYHFANIYHTDVNITLLQDDFLGATTTQNTVLKGTKFEAPAIFKTGDMYHGLFSLSDGWNPTPGQSGYSVDILGKWNKGTNFAVDAGKDRTYRSQSAYVLEVEGLENAFIYMGDRWDGSKGPEFSDYVWLPISMRSGYPTVRWYDSWDLSVFNDMYRYKRAGEIVDDNIYVLLERESNRIVSHKSTGGIAIQDDNGNMVKMEIETTPGNYIYKIRDTETEKYLQNVFGVLRWMDESDDSAQEWYFDLQEDGYYTIENRGDNSKRFLTVSGNSTEHGANLALTDKLNDARYFALYFDSDEYEYETVDIFSKAYREENLRKIKERDAVGIEKFMLTGDDVDISPTVNNGCFDLIFNRETECDFLLQIFDLTGNKRFSDTIGIGTPKAHYDLSGLLTNGIYFVRITSPHAQIVKKMIVSKK